MSKFLDDLDSFNRKERYFVFTFAAFGDTTFRLSDSFRAKLGAAVGVDVPPEARAYVDYHLDWLHAAVLLSRANQPEEPWGNLINGDETSSRRLVASGTQEDIDLIVAFDRGDESVVILVEAKGTTSWGNSQLRSKATKLGAIFADALDGSAARVRPIFCLMSPAESAKIRVEEFPDWMRRPDDPSRMGWLHLPIPPGRKKVVGVDAGGKPSMKRHYWAAQSVGKDQLAGE